MCECAGEMVTCTRYYHASRLSWSPTISLCIIILMIENHTWATLTRSAIEMRAHTCIMIRNLYKSRGSDNQILTCVHKWLANRSFLRRLLISSSQAPNYRSPSIAICTTNVNHLSPQNARANCDIYIPCFFFYSISPDVNRKFESCESSLIWGR